jgi:Holliday junction resolvase RusA-like endonuclease
MRARFCIPGAPYGKARHRSTRMGIQYTPKETVNYETLVRTIFKQSCPDWHITFQPVHVIIKAFYPIPKSKSQKIRGLMSNGLVVPTKRPDWDNIGKIITDSLNQIAWNDDAQVYWAEVIKSFSDVPQVDVAMETLDEL